MRMHTLAVLFGLTLIAGCGGGSSDPATSPTGSSPPPSPPPPPPATVSVTLEGVVEKGPFVSGSAVSVYALTDAGTRDVLLQTVTTADELGTFSVDVDSDQIVEIEAAGQFLNEVNGVTTNASLTLSAILPTGRAESASSNVNILTHLAAPRHRALLADPAVSEGDTDSRARADLLAALEAILPPPPIASLEATQLFATDPDDESSAYLVALSAAFSLHAGRLATEKGSYLVRELQQVLDSMALDLADGVLDDTSLAGSIRASSRFIEAASITANLLNVAAGEGSALVPGNVEMFLDRDLDGIANLEDDDDDGDGIADADDAYPLDWSCYLASQGNGATCSIEANIPNAYAATAIVEGDAGVLYILDAANNRIVRWSMDWQAYGWTLDIPPDATAMAYSPAQDRLYVGHASGAITAIDAGGLHATSLFATLPRSVETLVAVGDNLLAIDDSDLGATYSIAGAMLDQAYLRAKPGSFAWNQSLGEVAWLNSFYAVPEGMVIDSVSGTFGVTRSAAQYRVDGYGGPLRISSDGNRLATGSNGIYDTATLSWQTSLPSGFVDFGWIGAGALAGLRDDAAGTRVEHLDLRGEVIEYGLFPGSPVRAFHRDRIVQVITQDERPQFHSFVLGGDFDGDAVPNTEDAFPTDVAASVDSDLDGYPDDWNDGRSAADSTSGLVRDAYPFDSICYLSGHGDGAVCDIEASVPAFNPDAIVADGRGVVYLLSQSQKRVYRWSPDSGYMNPFLTHGDDLPDLLRYSPENDRLYVGYTSGRIGYWDLGSGLAEQYFTALPTPLRGLEPAGSFLWAAARSSGSTARYNVSFDEEGGIAGGGGRLAEFSRHSAWNASLARVYFFRDGISPNDINYIGVNQDDGSLGETVDSPYHGAYSIVPPIRLSLDGSLVLLGSGDIYNASDLTRAGSITGGFKDALWTDSNGTIVVRETAGNSELQRRDATGRIVEVATFPGIPLALLRRGAGFTVVTTPNSPVFHDYQPSDDSDGDGVDNVLDAFPLDPAASADSDRDGYPDAWNAGKTAADSTTGLTLDAYPDNAACYLPEHGDGTICDTTATLPDYVPASMAVDSAGVLYLFSPENNRIYRRDTGSGDHLDPFVIGSAISGAAPTLMAYHDGHDRLYVAYDNGEIHYIDLAGGAGENWLATAPGLIGGMAEAGNFLLVQDDTGSRNTHHIFGANGGLRTSVDWNHYSSVYAWNETLNRVYFFRDESSPNDLLYEDIDQDTGEITASGESPYHGQYAIMPPIRVSSNDALVLLGSGDIFDAVTLDRLGAIPGGFVDAQWTSGGEIVSVTDNAGNAQIVRRDANGNIVDLANVAGIPLALFPSANGYVVVIDEGRPEIVEYVPSDDSDGDGVANGDDAFPLDPAASDDSDADGYPNAWNPGMTAADSTTGLAIDAYPDDAACYLPEHGDGSTCDITATMPDYVPASMALDSGGILYLFSPENNRVYRRDTETGNHLNPFVIGSNAWLASKAPTVMGYHRAHDRLYLGYESGEITFIDLAAEPQETGFTTLSRPVGGLADAGNFLLVQDDTGSWASHHVYDAAGVLKDSREWNQYSREYAFNPTLGRIYYFRDGSSPNDLMFEDIDQASGLITANGETPYHGDYDILPPIRVSADGSMVLLGSGDIYDAGSLTRLGAVPGGFVDAQWTGAGGIVTVTDASGNSQVIRRNENGTIVEGATFPGAPLGLFRSATDFIVVIDAGIPEIVDYVPSDDSDGDGVQNVDDAFPQDVAASVDSDGDGYPDAWNPGMTAADSTTGLEIDAYPDDAACYLPEHGDGTTCDITATMPDYRPVSMALDGDGILYLFSPENGRIYRRDTGTGDHLNPFVVGTSGWLATDAPMVMAHHRIQGRLYLGYESGEITYIDLAGEIQETPFVTLSRPVGGLADVGNFLLAQDDTGAWESHHIYDVDGILTASREWNHYSRAYAFNPALGRVYYFRDGTSPNDLMYEDVDQVTGLINEFGESPYHGDYDILPPIRVSADGSMVLLGSGDIYDGDTLAWLGAVPGGFVDAQWTGAGGVVSIADLGANSQVIRRDASGRIVEGADFAGAPLGLYRSGSSFVVVVDQGIPEVATYVPSDDSDGDGVANGDDAFPTDPAASADSDNDGYPDAWNSGMTAADSTTGLIVDAYPTDTACYLPEHGDGTTCDIGATIPDYAPQSVAVDNAGVVYLFSPDNGKVFRWDSAAGQHMNPFVIGNDVWLGADAPTVMALHAGHDRLYFGYDSGSVNYIDLAGDARETLFATLSQPVRGLADVGNFVLAQDDSGAWESHHIFDANGILTASREWNHYSRVYSFNAVLGRVYYFRDGTSPNDLMYEDIDQDTGSITADGETPYHGDYPMIPPIRTSVDGSRVVLGSGDVYDASDLTWIGSYASGFTDGDWLADGRLVTIRPNGAYTAFEVRNPVFGVDSASVIDDPPLAVRRYGDNVVVITSGAKPGFTVVTP